MMIMFQKKILMLNSSAPIQHAILIIFLKRTGSLATIPGIKLHTWRWIFRKSIVHYVTKVVHSIVMKSVLFDQIKVILVSIHMYDL